jgi:hypothetical protein
VVGKKVINVVHHIADLLNVFLVKLQRRLEKCSSKTPKTSGEMTAAEKKSRIAQKKRLGQPAGKPRRVASLRRKKTTRKKA